MTNEHVHAPLPPPLNGEPYRRYTHVYPLYGRAHVTDRGLDCWCRPVPDVADPSVLIHNAEQ